MGKNSTITTFSRLEIFTEHAQLNPLCASPSLLKEFLLSGHIIG